MHSPNPIPNTISDRKGKGWLEPGSRAVPRTAMKYPNTPNDCKPASKFSSAKYASPSSGIKETLGDRFIPMRACANLFEKFIAEDEKNPSESSPKRIEGEVEPMADVSPKLSQDREKSTYCALLMAQCLNEEWSERKKSLIEEENNENVCNSNTINAHSTPTKHMLSYRTEYKAADSRNASAFSPGPIPYSHDFFNETARPVVRKLPQHPVKVLDAPGLVDDFYLNIMDWSNEDVIAVGLKNSLYCLSQFATKVEKILELPPELELTALSFCGSKLAAGLSNGVTYLIDSTNSKLIGTFTGHDDKISCCSWGGEHCFSTGGRDKKIFHRDIRKKDGSVRAFEGHKQEVCGLKWSCDKRFLASGGNDNKVLIWDLQHPDPILKLAGHKAAVKALAWDPFHSSILSTGGGTADKTIKQWDVLNGNCLRTKYTGSQVCALLYSQTTSELVSSHGFSQFEIKIWKANTLSSLGTLSGHLNRVLYLALSPDGETLLSGAGDETVQFWNLFPNIKPKCPEFANSTLFPSCMDIR